MIQIYTEYQHLKMKIPILWMYDYPCNISMVCTVVTRLYLYSTNLYWVGNIVVN